MSAYRTVVVGTDGSESSLKAVDRAASIAADASAQLIIACAYYPADPKDVSAAAAWHPGDWIVVATSSFSPFESEFVQIEALSPDAAGEAIPERAAAVAPPEAIRAALIRLQQTEDPEADH